MEFFIKNDIVILFLILTNLTKIWLLSIKTQHFSFWFFSYPTDRTHMWKVCTVRCLIDLIWLLTVKIWNKNVIYGKNIISCIWKLVGSRLVCGVVDFGLTSLGSYIIHVDRNGIWDYLIRYYYLQLVITLVNISVDFSWPVYFD